MRHKPSGEHKSHAHPSAEHHRAPEHGHEAEPGLAELIRNIEAGPSGPSAEKDQPKSLAELQHEAKTAAMPAEATARRAEQPANESSHKDAFVSRELKHLTFSRTLTRVRKHLSAPERNLSRVVHQPVVDAISKAGEQTIARPSGLLGGSLVAFVGSSVFLWAARHYGFRYNYLLFFLLFVAGFGLGMIVELILFVLRRKRAQ